MQKMLFMCMLPMEYTYILSSILRLLKYISISSSLQCPNNKGTSLSAAVYMIMGVQKPEWLEAICTQRFFSACSIHETAKRNEKNICCLDCCTSICPHCVHSHRFHRLLQVRRYVYHDVVSLEDLEKLIDCSNVQAYTINGAKVVFIKKRPQNRQFNSGSYCTSCERSLQEPFIHCSLGCKVDFILKQYQDLSPFLRICNSLQLGPDFFIPQCVGDDDMSNDSTICNDQAISCCYSLGSGSSTPENMSMFFTEFVRKKRGGVLHVCGRSANKVSGQNLAMSMSRRKGIPQRSPLC